MLNHSHVLIEEKAGIVHKLKETIVKNTEQQNKINEMKDIGKREAEFEYKKQYYEQLKQHKKEVDNLTQQYTHLLQGKDVELNKFVDEFKRYHKEKKEEVTLARKEISQLY
jgi:trans-aconitate methyltransferase